jgi:hypothetical protein
VHTLPINYAISKLSAVEVSDTGVTNLPPDTAARLRRMSYAPDGLRGRPPVGHGATPTVPHGVPVGAGNPGNHRPRIPHTVPNRPGGTYPSHPDRATLGDKRDHGRSHRSDGYV